MPALTPGDWKVADLELAAQEGIDPGPIDTLSQVKHEVTLD